MKSRPLFTNDQVKRLANILDNAGQVLIATVVLPAVSGILDQPLSRPVLWIGILATAGSWWAALRLERISS